MSREGKDFHLELNSIEDFIAFVMILRGKELDLKEIQHLSNILGSERDKLRDAVNSEKGV